MPAARKPSLSPHLDSAALLEWYDGNARQLPWRVSPAERARGINADPYRVWLSEIMLQQTGVVTVGRYFADFTTRWPNVAELAAAPLDAVLTRWAGLGYYARARNLHRAARILVREHGSIFPSTSAGLMAIPGIGPYTAAAIAAICFDEKVAVVDGNVERVAARLRKLDRPVRELKPEIREFVQAAVPERAGDFAQALMDLGASLCAPRAALCASCPLEPGCLAAQSGQATDYPVKPAKPVRPVRHGHAFVMTNKDGAIALRQRPPRGLLGGMMEVPGSDWIAELSDVSFPYEGDWRKAGKITHIFTHFRLELDIWCAEAPVRADASEVWAKPSQLETFALPTLYRKVLAEAGIPPSHKRSGHRI